MGKPIEGKIAANNCPFVPFPGVCLPRLAELNKTHLSCNSHNIPRAPFGARRGERRGRAGLGRMGSTGSAEGRALPGLWGVEMAQGESSSPSSPRPAPKAAEPRDWGLCSSLSTPKLTVLLPGEPRGGHGSSPIPPGQCQPRSCWAAPSSCPKAPSPWANPCKTHGNRCLLQINNSTLV